MAVMKIKAGRFRICQQHSRAAYSDMGNRVLEISEKSPQMSVCDLKILGLRESFTD